MYTVSSFNPVNGKRETLADYSNCQLGYENSLDCFADSAGHKINVFLHHDNLLIMSYDASSQKWIKHVRGIKIEISPFKPSWA